MADAREIYDPARDLAVLLHAALRQGHWQPAALGSLRRLQEHVAHAGEFTLASDIEIRLREVLSLAGRRQAALDNVAYLAALPDEVLREALLAWRHEHPDRARQLRRLLSGATRADRDEEAAAAAVRLHEDAAAFRTEMAGSEADLDGFVERTLAKVLPEERRPRDQDGPPAGYTGAI